MTNQKNSLIRTAGWLSSCCHPQYADIVHWDTTQPKRYPSKNLHCIYVVCSVYSLKYRGGAFTIFSEVYGMKYLSRRIVSFVVVKLEI